LFGRDDIKAQGANFKCIFKVTNVRDVNSTFLSCLATNNSTQIGLEMKAHETNIYTSGGTLTQPYSEDDIIEFEYNINALTGGTSYIMVYEDGVGARPLIYDDTYILH